MNATSYSNPVRGDDREFHAMFIDLGQLGRGRKGGGAFTSRFFGEGGEIAQNGEKSGEADVADRLEQTSELVYQENNVCLTISHYHNGQRRCQRPFRI